MNEENPLFLNHNDLIMKTITLVVKRRWRTKQQTSEMFQLIYWLQRF